MDTIKNVVDVNGVSYDVISELGEGSQGKTFLLQGENYIAKLFKNNTNIQELSSKINFLINLNLDRQNFSIPLRELATPHRGYISEFASGMESLSVLQKPTAGADFSEWFTSTGGLIRRYGVLIKLAKLLRELHAKGLVYCDLSPNNVFISSNPQKHHVFLIDMDNLRYKTSIIHNIYTPFYGAPEIVKGIAPNTPMSDCFSFAVIAYELLTCNHPLIGDIVDDGEPEMEEKALRGELPWVDNQQDDSNARSTGLPSSLFVSKRLMKLFDKTFDAGLNNPMNRPTMSEWYDVLNETLNDLVYCKDCGIHYPFSNSEHCPFCNQSSVLSLPIKVQRIELEEFYNEQTNTVDSHFTLQPIIMDKIMMDENTSKYIKAYHFLSTKYDYDTPLMLLKLIPTEEPDVVRLRISPLNGLQVYFKIPKLEITESFNSEKTFRLNIKSHTVMFFGIQELTLPQRVLVL